MRLWARILLVALLLAPWAPVPGCPAPGPMSAAAATASGMDECCCEEGGATDESSCCSPEPAAAPHGTAGGPCCSAGDAPNAVAPALALVGPAPIAPIADLTPEPWFASAASDDARRVATTESPPASPGLIALSENRLRL